MTEQVRQHRSRAVRDTGRPAHTEDETAADLRNGELDEDVACCLAEIDEVLDAERTERDQAAKEFDQLSNESLSERALKKKLNLWQAKYAHLGLSYGWCCGVPRLMDTGKKN
jgi:uridylate kinase